MAPKDLKTKIQSLKQNVSKDSGASKRRGQLADTWKDYRYKQIEYKRGMLPKHKGPYRYLDLVRDGIAPEADDEFVPLQSRDRPPSKINCSLGD